MLVFSGSFPSFTSSLISSAEFFAELRHCCRVAGQMDDQAGSKAVAEMESVSDGKEENHVRCDPRGRERWKR